MKRPSHLGQRADSGTAGSPGRGAASAGTQPSRPAAMKCHQSKTQRVAAVKRLGAAVSRRTPAGATSRPTGRENDSVGDERTLWKPHARSPVPPARTDLQVGCREHGPGQLLTTNNQQWKGHQTAANRARGSGWPPSSRETLSLTSAASRPTASSPQGRSIAPISTR